MIMLDDFQNEVQKLITRFDKKYYPPEVVQIIWREVKDLDIFWLKKTVATFLGQHKPALLPEFRELARIEKDRKRNSGSNISSPVESILTKNQQKFMWSFIKAVAAQKIRDQKKYLEFVLPVMDKAFREKDLNTLHELFIDISKQAEIEYGDQVPDGAA